MNRTDEPEDERMEGEGSTRATTDTVPSPADEVEELRKERDSLQDRLLRQAAEFDNYRKRIDRERRESAQYAAVDFVQDLLPVIDDFERALQTDAPGAESYRQGLEIIHRALMDMLRKRGVTPIDAVGTDFDPQIHQAVAHEEAADRRDGEVIEQFTRGYRLGDKLIRPAMVKVAKA
jgi:molecular chaperone GrpE